VCGLYRLPVGLVEVVQGKLSLNPIQPTNNFVGYVGFYLGCVDLKRTRFSNRQVHSNLDFENSTIWKNILLKQGLFRISRNSQVVLENARNYTHL
jgi:hypothetical protein